jgi:predicted alpha/beta hydrolase family esterase
MHDEQLEAIDDWIAALGEKISRAEAIHRLVALGLGAPKRLHT